MIARLITAAPALLPLAGVLVVGIWAIAHAIYAGRHVPAAPDNQQGTDVDDLITCRRILRETETRKEKPKP